MRRGEIWWASLPEPEGSGPGFRRPVVVIQSDLFNDSRIGTTVVAAVSSNLRLADAPGNVLVQRGESSLSRDSVINVSQILTLDKSFLTDRVSTLSARIVSEIDEGVHLVLGL